MIEEIWKVYKITTNHRWGTIKWEVSNFGRVKKNNELYECGLNKQGYKYFSHQLLSRIVATLFIENNDNALEVDHIDGDKLNNRVDNLRWVTHKDNMRNPATVQKISGENNPIYGKPSPFRGKHHTEEVKEAQRQRMLGNNYTAYKKNFNSIKGRHRCYNEDGTYKYI